MKTCSRCGRVKPIGEFTPLPNGYVAQCKPCRAESARERRAAFTPEERKMYNAKRMERHWRSKAERAEWAAAASRRTA